MGYFSSIYMSGLPHRAVAVYMYLRDRTDAEGKCYPSIKTIGRELSLSRSTVKRALKDLRKDTGDRNPAVKAMSSTESAVSSSSSWLRCSRAAVSHSTTDIPVAF